ncbi:galectin-1-like isoform X2 [Dreissena polymorpha]|uniref:galectin-1-like isoform X2 n=1 Tax=Dreissena polymorpha TaxID=45954 RepID=UPI0022650E15|nr:galectin-1-like isoform X2 [Dreissena polymorpha]
MVRHIKQPSVPFVHFIDTESIQVITIKGRAPSGASRFSVYLQHGAEAEPHEIAFVFDARFNFSGDHNKVVTNSKKGGAWGTEEHRNLPFPFHPDQDFKIKITVDDDSFKMKVNGQKFLEYEQKLSMKSINCIRIQNDIIIHEVELG